MNVWMKAKTINGCQKNSSMKGIEWEPEDWFENAQVQLEMDHQVTNKWKWRLMKRKWIQQASKNTKFKD